MTGLWIKLAACPAIVLWTDYITQEVFYPTLWQAILVGVLLAVAGHLLEVMLLRPGRLWLSTMVDFFAAAAIAFVSQFFLLGTYVSFVGALLLASFLAIAEHLMHLWLIRNRMAEKAG